MRTVGSIVVATLALFTTITAADVAFETQSRHIDAGASVAGYPEVSDSRTAPDFGPFDTSLSVSNSPPFACGYGSGGARQTSQIGVRVGDALKITNRGGVSGSGAGCAGHSSGGGTSYLSVTFTVDASTPVSYTGSYPISGFYDGYWEISLRQAGPGTNYIFQFNGPTASTQQFQGALTPGRYTYLVNFNASGNGPNPESSSYDTTLVLGSLPACVSQNAWTAFGTGMSAGYAYALAPLGNSNLVAAGDFTAAGGITANRIARWNGTEWTPLGSGMNEYVSAVLAEPNGVVYAGGAFTTPGNRIARWTGSTWSAMGTGMNDSVHAITYLFNGNIVAAGAFTTAGGAPANRIARWNGSSWSAMGTGMNNYVNVLTVMPNGHLIAGGSFTTAGGAPANNIARWNGSAWVSLGTGVDSSVGALLPLANGDLIVGGLFTTAGGVPANNIARWNGTTWSALGTGMNGFVGSLALLPGGDIVAADLFTTSGGVTTNHIARWNGSTWSALATGMNGRVYDIALLSNGKLVASGEFTAAGGVPVDHMAQFTFGPVLGVSSQPQIASTCPSGAAAFSVVASGTGPFTYHWRKGGEPMDAGANPSAATAMLSLTNVQLLDAGTYDCVISNDCESVISNAATLEVCIGDYNCDGGVDGGDVDSFFVDWEAGNAAADVNSDGGIDGGDVELFFARWEAGC